MSAIIAEPLTVINDSARISKEMQEMKGCTAPMRGKKAAALFTPTSGDKRFKLLEVAIKRHQFCQDA
jgi:hypothetical protein